MATEYKLSYTATEIDERLTHAGQSVLYIEQQLTDEQKTQARANIEAANAVEVDNELNDIKTAIASIMEILISGKIAPFITEDNDAILHESDGTILLNL